MKKVENEKFKRPIPIDELESQLKKSGTFYKDYNTGASYFRLKSDKEKKLFWIKGEAYREFLERCNKMVESVKK